jgi:tetratricopeptide (TPR) repeat protein
VLHAVSPLDETLLQQGLRQLIEAELIYQRGLPPQATYLFKHALIQDAAYQSLLKSKRQQYHQQIAQVLEEQFAETTETQPELLARHYAEAGLVGQAVSYWQKAGQRATQRSANVEAINHLTQGLEVLKTLPDTPKRAQQELTLQIALGGSLMTTKGYGVSEAEKAYARARELCRQVGETPQLFPALWGLHTFYATVGGEVQTVQELEEQLWRLAQRAQDPTLLLMAYRVRGVELHWRGEFAQALEHVERGIALYDRRQHHALAFRYVNDPGVQCLSYAAVTLWYLGHPDRALQRVHAALTLAQELAHQTSLAHSLYWAAWLHRVRGEVQVVQERAGASMALSGEQGFAHMMVWGTVLQGWALVEQGQGEEGIAQMRRGLAASRAMGILLRPYFLALLAEGYGKVGQPEEGLSALAEAQAIAHENEVRHYEAELYRLKGELTLQQFKVQGSKFKESRVGTAHQKESIAEAGAVGDAHPTKAAEAYFLKAIEVARRQQAKSLELRAVISLSRLWQQQGKTEEARQLLAEIYNWFTEGFDTKDLQEAKALLEELNH